MGSLRTLLMSVAAPAALLVAASPAQAQTAKVNTAQDQTSQDQRKAPQSMSQAMVDSGRSLFLQHCAFCHGRDAGGGETGPDLTSSSLVEEDVAGDKIGGVIRNGRPDKGMPPFNLSPQDISALAVFIHYQRNQAEAHPGGRRRVSPADLQTGNAELGKQYFNGAGQCSSCHSPTGDLAGIASRFQGLRLEMRMLYPEKAKAKVTVTLPNGQTVTGSLAYQDEFTVGLRDTNGWYHSWPANEIKYQVDAPAEAHAKLLAKYTDDDIHNLMAYLVTLR